MPDPITGAELPAERLARVRAEVASLRASLAAQLDSGAEKSTGVFRISEVDFSKIETRLRAKERELAALEALASGDPAAARAALGFATLATRGQEPVR